MRLTLVADCKCKTQHITHNYSDTYHTCNICKEPLFWYDPYEVDEDFEQEQKKSNRKNFKRDL